MEIKQGSVESKRLQADFSGRLNLAVSWADTAVNLTGTLRPRPEFFATFANGQAVEVLRRSMRDGALSFTVSGPLTEPGILFADLPPSFDTSAAEIEVPAIAFHANIQDFPVSTRISYGTGHLELMVQGVVLREARRAHLSPERDLCPNSHTPTPINMTIFTLNWKNVPTQWT